MSDYSSSTGPAFGPPMADRESVSALEGQVRLRIHLEGCRGLPQTASPDDSNARRSYTVAFDVVSHHGITSAHSTPAQEGRRLLRGTVYWNEVLYLDCSYLSYIGVILCIRDINTGGLRAVSGVCVSVTEFLTKTELSLWPSSTVQEHTNCTIFHSSQAHQFRGQTCSLYRDATDTLSESGDSSSIDTAMASGTTTIPWLHDVLTTSDTAGRLKALSWPVDDSQNYIFNAYERSMFYHPRVDALVSSIDTMIDAVIQFPHARMSLRAEHVPAIWTQMFLSAGLGWSIVLGLGGLKESKIIEKRIDEQVSELGRLAWIAITPDPTSSRSSTSACSTRQAVSSVIAKDALLLILEAIVQASDAFPPLKSVASGLFFFAMYADMASGNKKQIRGIYKRVDGLVASLKRGVMAGGPSSPAHQEAVKALAEDIAALCDDLQSIVRERRSRFRRYFSAKRHREELQGIVWQLDSARANYTAAVATLNGTTIAQVLAHLKALTLIMGVSATPVLEAPRSDASAFPYRRSSAEEF